MAQILRMTEQKLGPLSACSVHPEDQCLQQQNPTQIKTSCSSATPDKIHAFLFQLGEILIFYFIATIPPVLLRSSCKQRYRWM